MASRNSAHSKPGKRTKPGTRPIRKWSKDIKTESTFPPKGTFTRPGDEVARIMARKRVSPGGLGSAIRMVQLFINRAGRTLSPARRRELEKAKRILQHRRAQSHR